MNLHIRKMNINDYHSVYELWIHTTGMGLNNLDDSEEGIHKFLKRNPDSCFVAEKAGEIVGVILSGHDGRRGFIYHTVVAKAERKQGIGTYLVEQAMSALKNEGIHKVALVAFAANESGNAFWEQQGFSARNDLIYRNKSISEMIRIDT